VKTSGADCGSSLVLKGNPSEYSAGSIQEIATDVSVRNFSTGVLQQVPGAYSASSPRDPNVCIEHVTFKNLGSTTIVLKGAVITNAISSEPNSYHYNLFDCAPYPSLGDCPAGFPTFAGCNLVFTLTQPTAGTSMEQDCPQGTLSAVSPQESGAVVLILSSTQKSRLYKVGISLILGEGSKITLPTNLDDVLVYASPSQFSCYSPEQGKLVRVSAEMTHCL
jgi:hypothetical protein